MANPELPPAPIPRPAGRFTRAATTGETVTVACKLPHGLVLRCFAWEEYDEPLRDGTMKRTKRSREIQEMRFTIRGTWVGSAGQAYARNNPAVAELLPGGYALTHGVPRDVWDLWYTQNRNSLIVRNHIVFAHASPADVNTKAKELRHVQSGLEPTDPDRPADRMPGIDRRLRAIGQLVTDEGTASR